MDAPTHTHTHIYIYMRFSKKKNIYIYTHTYIHYKIASYSTLTVHPTSMLSGPFWTFMRPELY